jgi:hypothetical protein
VCVCVRTGAATPTARVGVYVRVCVRTFFSEASRGGRNSPAQRGSAGAGAVRSSPQTRAAVAPGSAAPGGAAARGLTRRAATALVAEHVELRNARGPKDRLRRRPIHGPPDHLSPAVVIPHALHRTHVLHSHSHTGTGGHSRAHTRTPGMRTQEASAAAARPGVGRGPSGRQKGEPYIMN